MNKFTNISLNEMTATSSKTGEQNQTTHEERKAEYQTLLGIVEHNTGGRQPALAHIPSVKQIAIAAGVTAPRSRLKAAVENGDLLRIRDRVVRTTEPDLRDALGELNGQRQDVVAALQEVVDGGE